MYTGNYKLKRRMMKDDEKFIEELIRDANGAHMQLDTLTNAILELPEPHVSKLMGLLNPYVEAPAAPIQVQSECSRCKQLKKHGDIMSALLNVTYTYAPEYQERIREVREGWKRLSE